MCLAANILRATFHLHRSSVDTSTNPVHRLMLDDIWAATGLDEDERVRWDLLGLEVQGDGQRARPVWKTGRLGLNSLVSPLIRDGSTAILTRPVSTRSTALQHSFATDKRNSFSNVSRRFWRLISLPRTAWLKVVAPWLDTAPD